MRHSAWRVNYVYREEVVEINNAYMIVKLSKSEYKIAIIIIKENLIIVRPN